MAMTIPGFSQVLYDAYIDEYADEYAWLVDRPAAKSEFKAAINTPEKFMRFVARLHGDDVDED